MYPKGGYPDFPCRPKDQNNSAAQNAPELELTYNWDPEDMIMGVILVILPIKWIIFTKPVRRF